MKKGGGGVQDGTTISDDVGIGHRPIYLGW